MSLSFVVLALIAVLYIITCTVNIYRTA